MLIPFYIGLYKWYGKARWSKFLLMIGQIIGIASGFALIMIGVFPETSPPWHHIWSMVFFILNLVVLILVNIALWGLPKFHKAIAIYGFLVAVINMVTVVTGNESALVEWFTVFTALAYAGMLVINMLKAFPASKK
jgi:hypothetical membrane protein